MTVRGAMRSRLTRASFRTWAMVFGREGAIGCQIRQSGGSVRTASQQARVLPLEDSPTRKTSWLWPPMAMATVRLK